MIMKNLRNCLSLKHEVGGQGEENGEGDANRNFIDHQKKERKRERQIQTLAQTGTQMTWENLAIFWSSCITEKR